MHMTEKGMTPFECLCMDSSIVLMVMNHGVEAHTMYTVAFRYFQKNKTKQKKHENAFTTLKHAPTAF